MNERDVEILVNTDVAYQGTIDSEVSFGDVLCRRKGENLNSPCTLQIVANGSDTRQKRPQFTGNSLVD